MLLLLFLAVEVLQNGIDNQVVDRSIPLIAQSDQALDRLLFHLFLWDVDRKLIKDFFLSHAFHLLIEKFVPSFSS